MSNLEKSILATIVYYDVISRPLTSFEIFKYLINSRRFFKEETEEISLEKITNVLENSRDFKNIIRQENGFYFLNNREEIVSQRIERQKITDQKWKKVKRIIKFLAIIPYMRMVLISGSLAINNTRDESDIDLLIIVKRGRIWTARALTALFFQIMGQRRHGALTKNRFCLNHYLSDGFLNIPCQSLYNARTYVHLIPALETDKSAYLRFQKANQWIKDYLFFYPDAVAGYLRKIKPAKLFNIIRRIIELALDTKLGDGLEYIFKKIQSKKIRRDHLTYQKGGRVIFNDQRLEFHPQSPEKEILEKYNCKMKELELVNMACEKDSGLTR